MSALVYVLHKGTEKTKKTQKSVRPGIFTVLKHFESTFENMYSHCLPLQPLQLAGRCAARLQVPLMKARLRRCQASLGLGLASQPGQGR